MHACCVHVHVCVCVYLEARSQDLVSSFIFSFESGSFPEPGTHSFIWAGWPVSSQNPPVSVFGIGITGAHHFTSLHVSTRHLNSWAVALHPPSQLPSSTELYPAEETEEDRGTRPVNQLAPGTVSPQIKFELLCWWQPLLTDRTK